MSRDPLAVLFGRNVVLARRKAGYSQRALARHAGLAEDSILKIEKGQRSVRLLTLLKLADALQVDPCVLLGGLRPCTDRPPPPLP